jgi:hypothetical protein
LLLLFFSKKTILQQRGRRRLIPHTPDITITRNFPYIRYDHLLAFLIFQVLAGTSERLWSSQIKGTSKNRLKS